MLNSLVVVVFVLALLYYSSWMSLSAFREISVELYSGNTERGQAIGPRSMVAAFPDEITRQYTILPKACSHFARSPFLVIIAFTRVDGFAIRQAIRKTWVV